VVSLDRLDRRDATLDRRDATLDRRDATLDRHEGTLDDGAGTAGRRARLIAAEVTDPEMPMLTLADLGVLREVVEDGDRVVVTITPTYSGCPAMATMRDDLVHRLQDHGYTDVEVRVSLSPAWSSDWISSRGRAALLEHGISGPGPAPRHDGPVALSLTPTRRVLGCPRCGSRDVELASEFGATACKAMYRCTACLEPFDHVKEI
jgi:ring-1,2-phenylacetyl-CoA epoxidase subunit PaaD